MTTDPPTMIEAARSRAASWCDVAASRRRCIWKQSTEALRIVTQGHRGRTFVILLPGEVTASPELLHPLIEDISLLHGAGRLQQSTCRARCGREMHCHWPTQSVHHHGTSVSSLMAQRHCQQPDGPLHVMRVHRVLLCPQTNRHQRSNVWVPVAGQPFGVQRLGQR